MNDHPIQFVFDSTASPDGSEMPVVYVLESIEPLQSSARRIIAAQLRLDPAQIRFAKDPHGRLFLENAANIDVSLSNSAALQAIGVCFHGRIGVDLEALRDDIDLPALSRDYLTPSEQTALHALPHADRIPAFYRMWTAKEALAKAIGHGFSLGLAQIEIATTDAFRSCRIARVAGSTALAGGWHVAHHSLLHERQDYLIAAVATLPPPCPSGPPMVECLP